jgi:ATP-dependent exoDNAse (exonuclease V) beta subunit
MPQSWQKLSFTNKHPRDEHITFHEPTHTYYIDGSSEKVISCTKFIHEFFPHFDPDVTIAKMMKSPKWTSSVWHGMSAEQIKKKWNDSGKEASTKGTAMHLAIEQFLHGSEEVIDPENYGTIEWKYFMNFWRDVEHDLVPYRSEWEVWMKEFMLCGSIDMVFYSKKQNGYVIYDWKRSKEIKTTNNFANGFGPVSHLPDSNYWHYTLQLNIYKYFLEKFYGLNVVDLCLVIIHPDNKNYRLIRLNMLNDEVEGMLNCRKRALDMNINKYIVLPIETCAIIEEEKEEEKEE